MPAFLFPGQGSQKAEAAARCRASCPKTRDLFAHAEAILPETVVQAMFAGPQDVLDHTRNAQPALLCVGVALAACLESLDIRPTCCAGHSLGEITALVVAGSLAFEDALSLVVERARIMSEEVPEGGMAAVLGLPPEAIEDLLPEDAQVANYNGPNQTVISGSTAALEAAAIRLKAAGARRVLPLSVSGPFHSKFMREAGQKLARYLETTPLVNPTVPFLSSVSGAFEKDSERIRVLLSAQLCSPVQWTEVMARLEGMKAVEVGPGSVLKGLAKRMEKAPEVYSADTPEACVGLRELVETLL